MLFSVRKVGFSSNLDASQIVSGEEIEGLTAKNFRGDFDLIRINFSFRENCDFKRQWALLILDSAQSGRFESSFLSEQPETAISRGLVARASRCLSAPVFESAFVQVTGAADGKCVILGAYMHHLGEKALAT